MSSNAHRHVELVLGDAVREYKEALSARLQSMYASHSAAGRLQSGLTVRMAVQTMDALACEALESTSAKVLEIDRSADAFAILKIAMHDLVEFFRDEMPTVIRMASGRMPCEPNSSIEAAALALFDAMESKIERKVNIVEFQFQADAPDTAPLPSPQSSKAGRRRSSFWDDMWASIARDLYEGDLHPQTQADIETAMLRWIENNGHSAAVSTVRGRARRLWDLIRTA